MKEPQTYGDLKKMLAKAKRGDWPSRVNKGMTHNEALDVLIAGIADHQDDEPLDGTRGELYRRNAMRECTGRASD